MLRVGRAYIWVRVPVGRVKGGTRVVEGGIGLARVLVQLLGVDFFLSPGQKVGLQYAFQAQSECCPQVSLNRVWKPL